MKFQLLQQRNLFQMYFDTYIKSNPSLPSSFNPSVFSQYNPPSLTSYEKSTPALPAFLNSRIQENSHNLNTLFNKNLQQITYNNRPVANFQNHSSNSSNPYTLQFQQKSNNVSVQSGYSNKSQYEQNTIFSKRKDISTISQNSKVSQNHNGINIKGYILQNSPQIYAKPTLYIQGSESIDTSRKNKMTGGNQKNFNFNDLKDKGQQGKNQLNTSKVQKQRDLNKQKIDEKLTTASHSYYSNLKIDQGKFPNKQFGFSVSTVVEKQKKSDSPLKFQSRQKSSENVKDSTYNFQLKNTTNNWMMGSNVSNRSEQYTYYNSMPSKKYSIKNSANQLYNGSKLQQSRQKHSESRGNQKDNLLQQKEQTPTQKDQTKNQIQNLSNLQQAQLNDSQLSKNMSIEKLLFKNSPYERQKKSNSSTIQRGSRLNQSQQSQQQQKQPQSSENAIILTQKPTQKKSYQQLIEKIQKKFQQQKKSEESSELKEKNLLLEIIKKETTIKGLQTIISNNKQTIKSMEQTIKQLKKNHQIHQMSRKQYNHSLEIEIEKIKKENTQLRHQNSQIKQHLSKYIKQYQQNSMVKLLEQSLTKTTKEKQQSLIQLNRQKQLHFRAIQQLNTQHEQLQRLKSEIINTKTIAQQKNDLLQNSTNKVNQLNGQLQHIQGKYQSCLEKLFSQNNNFEKQKIQLESNIQELKIQKELHQSLSSKLQLQVKTLENQLKFKEVQVQNMQQKLQKHVHSCQVSSISKDYQHKFENGKDSKSHNKDQSIKQFQTLELKIIEQQKTIETINGQLKEKNQIIQKITAQNNTLQNKVGQLQKNKVQSMEKQNNSKNSKVSFRYPTNDNFDLMLLKEYHQKYSEVISIFSFKESNPQRSQSSQNNIPIPNQHINVHFTSSKASPIISTPSREYLNTYHPLVMDEIKKIFKDLQKLLLTLKETQSDSQLKNQKIYELDKSLKKQATRINGLIGQIELKNLIIIQINNQQMHKNIVKLSEKYGNLDLLLN